jgi:hypothetical protein
VTDELVFVVPRASIADEAGWYGIRTDDLDAFLEALERDGRYEARTAMEVDPSFKQVIPYLVLRDGERFFLHAPDESRRRRTAPRSLFDRRRWPPQPGDGGVLGGLRREWHEELVAEFEPRSGWSACSTTTRRRSVRSTSAPSTLPTRPGAQSRSARPTS